ncbi:hypothetical protein Aduo_006016 [Ancylostoma duodenale]
MCIQYKVVAAVAASKSPIQQQTLVSTPLSKTQEGTQQCTKDKNRIEDTKCNNKVVPQKEVVKDKDKVVSQHEDVKEKDKKKQKSEQGTSDNTDLDAPPLQRRSNDESEKILTKKQLEALLGVRQETTPGMPTKDRNMPLPIVDAAETSQPGSVNMNSSMSSRKSKKRAGSRAMKTDITEDSACHNIAQDSLITPVSLNQSLKPVSHLLEVKKEVELQATQAPENDSIRTAVE